MEARVTAYFEKGYIAHPYWPEREHLINIQKESALNRVRSEAKREQVLNDYLTSHGMTVEQYRALEAAADRQWYMADGHIVIPARHIHGCLAQAADQASSAIRIARLEQVRCVVRSEDWSTDKTECDGTFERFVVVTGGAGKGKLSNQRALRSNEYIEDFEASGVLWFDEQAVKPKKLADFLAYMGTIGVGASRKLSWGRFVVRSFEAN